MNLFKNATGAILISMTLYIIGEPVINPGFVTREDYIRLIVSAIIGRDWQTLFFFIP